MQCIIYRIKNFNKNTTETGTVTAAKSATKNSAKRGSSRKAAGRAVDRVIFVSRIWQRKIHVTLAVTFTVFILVACGGGGGNESATPLQSGGTTGSTSQTSAQTTNQAQNTQTEAGCDETSLPYSCQLNHGGLTRTYKLQLPSDYSANEPLPLVLNLHGYGGSAVGQHSYSRLNRLINEQRFILLSPQGSLLDGTTHWNVGGWTSASTVDDVGFIDALITAVSEGYAVDGQRVYSTGMSNGGYMSFLLACQLSHRIAAVASVTGAMTPETYNQCAPSEAVGILQIHGTVDDVVPYAGNGWSRSIPDAMDYWVGHHQCDATASTDTLVDVNGDTAQPRRYSYRNCADNVGVEHIEMVAMGHVWPAIIRGDDIAGGEVVWSFLQRHTLAGGMP